MERLDHLDEAVGTIVADLVMIGVGLLRDGEVLRSSARGLGLGISRPGSTQVGCVT